VNLSDISKTGGIINAYGAIKLASVLANNDTKKKETLPKSTLNNNKD